MLIKLENPFIDDLVSNTRPVYYQFGFDYLLPVASPAAMKVIAKSNGKDFFKSYTKNYIIYIFFSIFMLWLPFVLHDGISHRIY